MSKNIVLYMHVPFCKSKCYYCDFPSFSDKENYIDQYINVMKKEIKESKLEQYNIKTIYIGGGTPSIISEKYISELLELINTQNVEEITIEINPGTATKQKLQAYLSNGINRISIGLQVTQDNLLKEIGRIHTYKDFLQTYNTAREVGFKNINIDLIFGLPNQTLQDVEQSLIEIIKLNPEHISTYSFILEEGTIFYKQANNDDFVARGYGTSNEETEREMYWLIKKQLENAGYVHYEISNFSKKGYESKHNNWYWEQGEYIGIGLSAHSFMNNIRYSNTNNLMEYVATQNKYIQETLNQDSLMKEYILLGLRKLDGIDLNKFKEKFKEDVTIIFKSEINKLIKDGLIEHTSLRLTSKGLDLANIVWQEFV